MICGTFTMTGMTSEEADTAVEAYKDTVPPPTSVTKKKEADGTYTVTAVYPDCADNVSHATSSP